MKTRSPLLQTALTLLACGLLLLAACNSPSGPTTTTPTPTSTAPASGVHTTVAVVFTPGQNVESNSATIPENGSSITLTNGPSAVKGTKVDFPAEALPSSTKVSVGYNTGSMKPNIGTYPGVALTLHVGTPADTVVTFDKPITITAPYTDTTSVPTPYYIDSTNHLEPVQLTRIDANTKTFSFQTFHASNYTWISSPQGTTPTSAGTPSPQGTTPTSVTTGTFDTGFVPNQDGFQIANYGSSFNRDGECFGFTSFALWYFQNAKQSEGNLYNKYMKEDFGRDNYTRSEITGQNVIATRAFSSISQYWTSYYSPRVDHEHQLTDEMRYNEIVNTLENSGPVLIGLENSRGGHSVLAYKVTFPPATSTPATSTPALSNISIYNPNLPGQEETIIYNTGTKKFEDYNDPSGYIWQFVDVDATGNMPLAEQYSAILSNADAHFDSSKDAQVTITSHTFTPEATIASGTPVASPSDTYSATVANSSVTLQGTIKSSQVLVTKFQVLVGQTNYQAVLKPEPDGSFTSFTVVLNLQRGVNHLTFKTMGLQAFGNFKIFIQAPNNLNKAHYVIKFNTAQSTYTLHKDDVLAIAWSHSGKLIATGDHSHVIHIWKPDTLQDSGQPLKATGEVRTLAWSPDDSKIAAGTGDNKVEVWDVTSGMLLLTYTGHTNSVNVVAWSPDGNYIASGSYDHKVLIWKPTQPSGSASGYPPVDFGQAVVTLAWAPDSTHIVVAGGLNTVSTYKLGNNSIDRGVSYTGHTSTLLSVSWSPDGNYIASSGNDGTVQVWDANSGNKLAVYSISRAIGVRAIAWSPDGKSIAAVSDDEVLRVWAWDTKNADPTKITTTPTYTYTASPYSLAWALDSKSIAVAQQHNVAIVQIGS